MALTSIGADTIEAFDETSKGANTCRAWYDYSRLQALESHNWNFARKRATLAASGDDPPPGVWAFRYQYPSDCVVLRKLQNPVLNGPSGGGFYTSDYSDSGDQSDAIPYEVELDDDNDAKSILTDLDAAVAIYTKDLENTALFSPYFIRMLSTQLAGSIAFGLTGKAEIEEKMFQRFSMLQLAAPAFNANEQVQAPPRDAEWVRGR